MTIEQVKADVGRICILSIENPLVFFLKKNQTILFLYFNESPPF